MVRGNKYDFKVSSVRETEKRIVGRIKGIDRDVFIAFAGGKTYQDYKHLRRTVVQAVFNERDYFKLDTD